MAAAKVTLIILRNNPARKVQLMYRDIKLAGVQQTLMANLGKEEADQLRADFGALIKGVPVQGSAADIRRVLIQTALDAGADIVVQLDADCRWDLRHLPDLLAPLKAGRAQVALASRHLGEGPHKGGLPWWRILGAHAAIAAMNAAMNKRYSDLFTGLRAYSKEALNLASMQQYDRSSGSRFDLQMLAQLHEKGFRFTQIPFPFRAFKDARLASAGEVLAAGWHAWTTAIALALFKLGASRQPWLAGIGNLEGSPRPGKGEK